LAVTQIWQHKEAAAGRRDLSLLRAMSNLDFILDISDHPRVG
jgi:hypothetical protein